MGNKSGLFKIEEAAVKTGLTKRALRYYEELKLIFPVRGGSGYRMYTGEDIEKVMRIKEIKDSLGFGLSEIKDIFELEKNLMTIEKDKNYDAALIGRSIDEINRQIKLIENKEATLKRVKEKYHAILQQLKEIK